MAGDARFRSGVAYPAVRGGAGTRASHAPTHGTAAHHPRSRGLVTIRRCAVRWPPGVEVVPDVMPGATAVRFPATGVSVRDRP